MLFSVSRFLRLLFPTTYDCFVFSSGVFVPLKDLINTVGSDLSSEDVRTAIKQFDSKGNGKVDFE